MLSAAIVGQNGKEPEGTPSTATEAEIRDRLLLENLVARAQTVAPEFGLDLLIRLASSKNAISPERRIEILESVIQNLRSVKNPLQLRIVPMQGISVDTHANYLSYAHDLRLDRLSLMSRAIDELSKLDNQRARQRLYEVNGSLDLKPIACSDALIYDVSSIYGALTKVAISSFDKNEINEGVRALFLATWIENIESPAQVGPALDLVASFQSIDIERQILSTALARSISKNFADDRTFSFVIERDRFASKAFRLASGTDDPSKAEIRSAFREFLVRNFQAERCAENKISDGSDLPRTVVDANPLFGDKPLKIENIFQTETGGGYTPKFYWTSEGSRRITSELRNVRITKVGTPISESAKAEDEWKVQVRSFIDSIESGNADENETESGVFNQKSVIYRTLIGLIPEGSLRDDAIRSFLRFLHGSRLQTDNFIEWYLHVKWLAAKYPEPFFLISSDVPNPIFQLMNDLRRHSAILTS